MERVAVRVTRRRARADEWALVLAAEGIEARIEPTPEGFAVFVEAGEVARGRDALESWERENALEAAPEPREAEDPGAPAEAIFVASLLLAFFLVTGPNRAGVVWFERGGADAVRIWGGEPWRAATALTLHADLPHVLGNAVAAALLFTGVFRAFGGGVGVALALAAGVVGNLANAAAHARGHVSVGASTAVFGALGLLAGRALVRGRARGLRGRRAATPLAAALALLAMIGTEGARVDLWAHAFGLAAGTALGALAAGARAGARAQALAGLVATGVLGAAWLLALGGTSAGR